MVAAQPGCWTIYFSSSRFSIHSSGGYLIGDLCCDCYQSVPFQLTQCVLPKVPIPEGNTYLKLRSFLGAVFDDELFAPLFPARGQPALAPWRLALVTIMQFAEGLSDRDAADAVRTRIDWKYLLGLELSDPGFNYSILSRFRARLVEGNAEMFLLQRLLERSDQSSTSKQLLERSPSCPNTHFRPRTAWATRHVIFRQQCPEGDEEQSLRAVISCTSRDLFLRRLLSRAAVLLVPNPAQIGQHPLS